MIDGGIPGVFREFHLSGDPFLRGQILPRDFRQVRSCTRHHAGSDSGYISHDASSEAPPVNFTKFLRENGPWMSRSFLVSPEGAFYGRDIREDRPRILKSTLVFARYFLLAAQFL